MSDENTLAEFLETFAPHTIEGEPSSVLRITMRGRITPAQARALLGYVALANAEDGHRLTVLADVREVGSASAETLSTFKGGLGDMPVAIMAAVGMNLAIRTTCKLMVRAVNLFKSERLDAGFFKTMPQAEAWLAKKTR